MRNRLILWAALLLTGFLAGFVPQRIEAGRLRDEAASCQERQRLAEVRELSALAYLEANRKNFGNAAQHVTDLFNRVRELQGRTEQPQFGGALDQMLQSRDAIMSALARADPESPALMQNLFLLSQKIR
jgi:hypothetical protein